MLSPALASGRMSIIYDQEEAARQIFTGPNPLTPERGGLRQDPGAGGVFRADDGPHRLTKVNGRELSTMSVDQMVRTLKGAIDDAPLRGGGSGLVGVDEIGTFFRDPAVKTRYTTTTIRGSKIRHATHNRIVQTPTGWRLVIRSSAPPVPGAAHPGRRLSAAMEILAGMPSPFGGSYASRVNFYMAPAFVTSVGEGRGPHFTLGRTGGKNIRPGWRGVVRGLALGRVWLEMYQGSGDAVSSQTWRNVSKRLGPYLAKHGGSGLPQLHFLISGTPNAPKGAPRGCGSPMSCQWLLANSTPAGRAVLANGPGAYRAGDQAAEWLANYNRYLPN